MAQPSAGSKYFHMKPIYLDYAATTPVDKKVFDSMTPFIEQGENFGNPSSLHSFGQKATAAIDNARITLAKTITANHREIIFTSGATEANNLIVRGVLKSFFKNQKKCSVIPRMVISAIEHPSVIETVRALEKDGAIEAVYLPVNGAGIVDLSILDKSLNERTILVSVMWVNNETGAVQPIEDVAKIIELFKKENGSRFGSAYPLFHSDAVQAFNCFDLNVIKSGVDLMTLSSHKIYGPKGAGASYIKNGVESVIEPITTGGDQEYGLRPGTENVPAIVGFASAAGIAHNVYKAEFERLKKLSEKFFEKIKKEFPEVEINGSMDNRSPHIINLYFPGRENLGLALDIAGVAASAGSACAQRYEKPSHVLSAMAMDAARIKGSIRFSFGRLTTLKDIDDAVGRIIIALNNKNK